MAAAENHPRRHGQPPKCLRGGKKKKKGKRKKQKGQSPGKDDEVPGSSQKYLESSTSYLGTSEFVRGLLASLSPCTTPGQRCDLPKPQSLSVLCLRIIVLTKCVFYAVALAAVWILCFSQAEVILNTVPVTLAYDSRLVNHHARASPGELHGCIPLHGEV
jgi:hypothetical protein